MQFRNAVIVDGLRTPFGRGGRGKLVATRLDEVGAQILRALLDRHPKVTDAMIEDVGLGNVSGLGEMVYLGTIPRLAGLPMEACSFNSNRQCGSSMETMHRIAMAIMIGNIDIGVAMGIERMGRAIGGGAGETRFTKMSDKISVLNEVQRAPAHDHAAVRRPDRGASSAADLLPGLPGLQAPIPALTESDRLGWPAVRPEAAGRGAPQTLSLLCTLLI